MNVKSTHLKPMCLYLQCSWRRPYLKLVSAAPATFSSWIFWLIQRVNLTEKDLDAIISATLAAAFNECEYQELTARLQH